MSQSADERLVVLLEARITEFEKRMAKAEGAATGGYRRMRQGSRTATQQMETDMNRASARINQALASTSTQIGSFAKSFAVGFAGGAVATAFAGLTSNINETIKGIAQIGDEAKRAGLAVQDFQKWKYVADQNRIGIDALVDGFKELNLRADEFIVTGGGSASEAFARLGFGAEDLKKKLKEPSALMLEIIGRLEGMDKAAQIRIADELFGGTGGEQFVQLLEQGEAAIRATYGSAEKAGAVLDEQMIRKAGELDRRWTALTTTAGNWFKGIILGTADAITSLGGLQHTLDTLLGDEARARAILGNEVYDALAAAKSLTEEQVQMVAELDGQTRWLISMAQTMAGEFAAIAEELAVENPQLANDLAAAAVQMEALTFQLEAGIIDAAEFTDKLGDVIEDAKTSAAELMEIDAVGFGTVLKGLDDLAAKLVLVAQKAMAARSAMPGVANQTTGTPLSGDVDTLMPPTVAAPTSSPRPELPSIDSYGDWEDAGKPKSGGGKKGGGRGSDRGITSLISDLMTPVEEIEAWHEQAMEVLNSATEAQLGALGGKQEAIERLEQEHADRLAAIDHAKHDQRISEAGAFFGSLAAIAQAGGDKLAKVARITGAAEAFANTLVAQSQVLRDPTLGFWGKMAAYTAIGAAGFGVVASLKGGSSSSTGSNAPAQQAAQAAKQTAPLQVLLNGVSKDSLYSGADIGSLLTQLDKEAGDRGYRLLVAR